VLPHDGINAKRVSFSDRLDATIIISSTRILHILSIRVIIASGCMFLPVVSLTYTTDDELSVTSFLTRFGSLQFRQYGALEAVCEK